MAGIKITKSLLDIEDRFDELPADLQEIARSLCWTLQVNGPVIDKRGNDYYFLFSYYDGDPEYYFDELNIQQNSAEQYNYLNLSEIARNPPEWMSKSTKKMKKSYQDDGDMIIGLLENYNIPIGDYEFRDKTGNVISAYEWAKNVRAIYPDSYDVWEISQNLADTFKTSTDGWVVTQVGDAVPTRLFKSSIHDMMSQIRANNNSLVKSRVDLNIGKIGPEDPYAEFQKEMASLGRILEQSGINYNLKDVDLPNGDYGYEIAFNSFEDGRSVFDRVADWGDAHGFYTWLKDEGIITLTPN